jgi:hypothetical protein
MEIVRVGGHFIQVTVANNFMGHDFLPAQPRVDLFTPENGRIEAVLLNEVVPGRAWLCCPGPSDVHQRVELCNSVPTYILTIAKRAVCENSACTDLGRGRSAMTVPTALSIRAHSLGTRTS